MSENKRHAWYWAPRLINAQGSLVRKDFAGALLGNGRGAGAHERSRVPGSRDPKSRYEAGLAYAAPCAELSQALRKAQRPELLARTPLVGQGGSRRGGGLHGPLSGGLGNGHGPF